MLSFLPALLLLMFRGPSALETAQLNTRAPQGGEAFYQRLPSRSGAFFALGRYRSYSKAVAQFLQLLPEELPEPSAEPVQAPSREPKLISRGSAPPADEAFAECERSRDGPLGL